MGINFLTESTYSDFKEKLEVKKPKSWLKSVSAFANGLGGDLYFGISDKTHKVVGIENVQEAIDKISEIIKDRITPMIKFAVQSIKEENKDIIKLTIHSGFETPYYYFSDGAKTAYIRMGTESVPAENHILHELILKGRKETFDAIFTDKTIKDLSFTLLRATYKQETRKDFNEEKDLISFGLADEEGRVTYAGLLFADQCDLYQSRVVCTRWNGLNKASRNSRCIG